MSPSFQSTVTTHFHCRVQVQLRALLQHTQHHVVYLFIFCFQIAVHGSEFVLVTSWWWPRTSLNQWT